jgi:hypothetical protein
MAPHNIEAEQALLGAILVNNEALYRVSDFLEPAHFYNETHQQIYDTARSLIRTGKLASPVTLKTFLPADVDIDGLKVAAYLTRLAAEATTIINAADYGRQVYDLAIRRDLIAIGEDMVNVAFDAPVDVAPREQIEDAERRLYELAEIGKYGGGFQKFETALTTAVDMAARAYQRDGKLSGLATGLRDLDGKMGGLQPSDLIIVAGRPGMGKSALATNIAYNVARRYMGEVLPDGHMQTVNGGIVGFFLARNAGTARDPHHRRAERYFVESDPARRHQRARLREDQGHGDRAAEPAVLHRRDRRPHSCATRGAGAAAQAPAGDGRHGHRLHPAPGRLDATLAGKPRAGEPRSPPTSRRSPRSSMCRSWHSRSFAPSRKPHDKRPQLSTA